MAGTDYTGPDYGAMALVTIDVQCDFLDDGAAAIPGTTGVLPNIRKLLRAFRAAHLPIIHVVRLYETDGSNADLCRRGAIEAGARLVRPGTPGAELAPELLPEPGARLDSRLLLSGELQPLAAREWVLYKPRWGAFFQTRLEQHLKNLGVTTLAFSGCNFPNCPRASMYEASERDFRIVLADDGVSGMYDRGRQELRNIGVVLMDADRLCAAISGCATAQA
jgi:nicotinamidase-related amidase